MRPLLTAQLEAAGRSFESFEITGGGFVATGPDAASVNDAAEKVRYRVAFYGSTPAYRGVFDLHGVGDLGVKLTEMSKQGQWSQMAAQVPDDVLDLFVARATYTELPAAIEKRYGGIIDTVSIEFAPGTSAATRREHHRGDPAHSKPLQSVPPERLSGSTTAWTTARPVIPAR